METNGRVKYLRLTELGLLSTEDRVAYDNEVSALRRQMRALLAHQDNPESITNRIKYTINDIINGYRLRDNRSHAQAKIMRIFVGDNKYRNVVMPIYEAKKVYESASKLTRGNMDRVGSPMDYMDLPTMYYFYKFRSEILKAYEARVISGKKLDDYDRLVEDVYSEHFATPSKENMFFQQKDINFLVSPVSSYVNICMQQQKREERAERDATDYPGEADEIRLIAELPITELIKADVMNYMISYVEKCKVYDEKDFDNISPSLWYTLKSIKTIGSRKYKLPQSKYMIEKYNFCDLSEDELGKYHVRAVWSNMPQAIKNRDAEDVKEEPKSTYIPQPPPRDPQVSIYDVMEDSKDENSDSEKESD